MSIYIPGIEMPSDGKSICIEIFSHGGVHEFGKCYPCALAYEIKTPHGELIERKSAKVRFCQHCHWKETIVNACDICAACPIDLIPTIVEAEGGREDG